MELSSCKISIISYLLVFVIFVPVLIHAQTFTHSVYVGPNSSFFKSRDSEINSTGNLISIENLGIIGGYSMEYMFPKTIIIGASIQYLSINSVFGSPCYCIHQLDRHSGFKNYINTQNIAIPFNLKLKTNKKNYTYINTGFGINWIFSSYREVDYVVSFINQDDPIITEIEKGSFILANDNNNSLGTFYQIGIGQKFSIRKISFYTEMSFMQDLNYWLYQTVETNDGVKEYLIKRQSWILKIGFLI